MRWSLADGGDPYALAEAEVSRNRQAPIAERAVLSPGGAVGYFGYDCVRAVERLAEPNPDVLGLPDMALMLSDVLVAFDHLRHTVTILANAYVDEDGGVEAAHARAVESIREVRERLAGPLPRPAKPAEPGPSRSSSRTCRARRSRRWSRASSSTCTPATPSRSSPRSAGARPSPVEPFSIYRGLRAVNPSPYMYFLDFGDFEIVGASPEPLVTVSGRRVSTRPIAGTRPRGGDAEEDQRIAAELLADEKERAEHVMLVDLGRNDLGRVCEYGTVEVETFMSVETYSHVMHIVSNVAGELREDVTRGRGAALGASRGHAVGRPQGAGDGDHRRARAGQARRLRRRGRLAVLRRPAGHLHLHPHRRGQGRRRPRAGGRRHRGRRQAGLRVRGVARQGPRRGARDRAGGAAGGLGMKVLMVDNYDSFTYNLVQYLGELGAEIETVRNDAVAVDDLLAREWDRVVVSPGPVHAERGGHVGRGDAPLPGGRACRRSASASATSRWRRRSAGSVVRHEPVHGKATEITHDGEGVFRGLPAPLVVGRYHSLVVDPDLPDGLEATAHGGGVLMAMRHRELPATGVQFHPESVLTPDGKRLLENFLA